MAYSKGKRAVMKVLEFLEELAASEGEEVLIRTPEPEKLRRALREGVSAAQWHKEYRRLYEALGGRKLQLKIDETFGLVKAKRVLREEGEVVKVPKMEGEIVERKAVVESPKEKPKARESERRKVQRRKVVEEVRTAKGVVDGMAGTGERIREVSFVNARLSEEEMGLLWKWAVSEGWKIIGEVGEEVSLTKLNVPGFLVWEPEAREER
jgi:hypothetical protein